MATLNPIKRVRLAHNKTLEEFSLAAGVHVQALYLNEQGVYPNILPAIERYLMKLGEDPNDLNTQYLEFQNDKRRTIGAFLELKDYVTLEPRYDEGHPFVGFRESLGTPSHEPFSRMGFAKSFCVHPAQLYRLEKGGTKHLPEQLREALTTAGLPGNVIAELESRCEEYVSGGWAQRAAS